MKMYAGIFLNYNEKHIRHVGGNTEYHFIEFKVEISESVKTLFNKKFILHKNFFNFFYYYYDYYN